MLPVPRCPSRPPAAPGQYGDVPTKDGVKLSPARIYTEFWVRAFAAIGMRYIRRHARRFRR